MAKGSTRGNSNGDNATGSPSSLTQLLSPQISPTTGVPNPSLHRTLLAELAKEYPLANPADDRRRYHPQRIYRPPGSTTRKAVRLVEQRVPRTPRATALAFNIPNQVAICLRRKARREVLHALNLKPKRGHAGGSRKRNPYSGVKC